MTEKGVNQFEMEKCKGIKGKAGEEKKHDYVRENRRGAQRNCNIFRLVKQKVVCKILGAPLT